MVESLSRSKEIFLSSFDETTDNVNIWNVRAPIRGVKKIVRTSFYY